MQSGQGAKDVGKERNGRADRNAFLAFGARQSMSDLNGKDMDGSEDLQPPYDSRNRLPSMVTPNYTKPAPLSQAT